MKQIFIALLLATTLISCTDPNPDSEARSTVSHLGEKEIEILLPETVTVNTLNGDTREGRLEAMNDTTLTLSVAGNSLPIPLAEVDTVQFSGDVQLYSTGEIVIRGDRNEEESNTPQTLTVPIANFRVGESGENMAIVDVTSADNHQGFIDNKNNRHFIVDGMKFEPSGNPENLHLEVFVEDKEP